MDNLEQKIKQTEERNKKGAAKRFRTMSLLSQSQTNWFDKKCPDY